MTNRVNPEFGCNNGDTNSGTQLADKIKNWTKYFSDWYDVKLKLHRGSALFCQFVIISIRECAIATQKKVHCLLSVQSLSLLKNNFSVLVSSKARKKQPISSEMFKMLLKILEPCSATIQQQDEEWRCCEADVLKWGLGFSWTEI